MTDLEALISEIEQSEPSRDLSDRVLLAIGWRQFSSFATGQFWETPCGERWPHHMARPVPLQNLQDATLVVPEGWRIAELRETDPTLKHMFACVTLHPHNGNDAGWKIGPVHGPFADELPVALALAGLKAKQAKREAEG